MVTCRLINFIFLTIENKLWTDQWKGWQAKWLPRLGRMLPTQELPLLMETLRISSDPQHHMSSVFACSSLLHLFFCCNHQYQYSENIKWPLITSFSSPSSLLPWYGCVALHKRSDGLGPSPSWSLILSSLILDPLILDPSIQFSVSQIFLPCKTQAPQVLPVGLLHPLLPGNPLLYTQVPHHHLNRRDQLGPGCSSAHWV